MRRAKRIFNDGRTIAGAGVVAVGAGLGIVAGVPGLAVLAFPAAGITVAAGVAKGVSKVRDRNRTKRATLDQLITHNPPRRASVEATQEEVGITRSPVADAYRDGSGWPNYVERNCDAALDEVLTSNRVVVLRGQAKEGKSRTAFEAVRRIPGDPHVALVRPGASVADLAELDDPWPTDASSVVVWLDKIDTYLLRTLTPGVRAALLADARVKIVGTIENRVWMEILNARDADTHAAAAVLREAATVHLEPPKEDEVERAVERYPEEGTGFANGIGQHFVRAPALHDAYDAAAPRERTAVLRAVVDWQRTGIERPISHRDLKRLYRHYLDGADPARWLDDGIAWASDAVDGLPFRLLYIDGEGRSRAYRTPDHVVDHVATQTDQPASEPAWELAVKRTETAGEAMSVGQKAGDAKRWTYAVESLEKACERYAEDSDEFANAAFRLGQARRWLPEPDNDGAIEAFGQAIAARHTQAWNLRGFLLWKEKGELAEAEEAFVGAIARENRTAAFNLLAVLAARDRLDAVDERFAKAVDAGNPAAALMLGTAKHAAGDLDAAARLYERADSGTRKVDGPHRKRAKMLGALVEFERGDAATARARFAEAWDEDEWREIVKHLRSVDFVERAEELRAALTSGAPSAAAAD
jgi:tetratricopeptide (TPR) repeat protein